MQCWSCGAEPVTGRFCAQCDKIQPLHPQWTAFDILGVPKAMGQAPATLERAFREASRLVHPDRFRTKSAIERRLALEQTTAVNEAFQRLRDPRRRAEYMLSLEGIEIGSEEHRTQDPALLMEMMELTERIDTVDDPSALETERAKLRSERDQILSALEQYFDQGSGETARAARQLERLRYLVRLEERIEGKLNP
jgi:molecular chaperone HscB